MDNMNIKWYFRECEIIFGIPQELNKNKIINFIILITKYYINKTKTKDGTLYFLELLTLLRSKIETLTFKELSTENPNMAWVQSLADVL